MSFVGASIAQAQQITAANSGISSLQAAVAARVELSTYNAKVALLDAKDVAMEGRLDAVEVLAASKVAQSTYIAKVAALDAKDVEVEARLDDVEALAATKVAQSAYDLKVAALEGADAAAAARLDAIEGDIAGRVQDAIDEKVAQTVFEALADELRLADSALTAAVATKVASVTQQAVDDAQNAVIAQKASIADLSGAITTVNASITSLQNGKVDKSQYNAKVAALEEFVQLMLKTYTITLPNNTTYAYNGNFQNALAMGFQPENPVSLAYNSVSKLLTFQLPNTAQYLSFVDMNINGAWVQRWNPALNQPNTTPFSRSGSTITINLSAFTPTGSITVFTRYDAYSGNSNAGTAQVAVA